jgi:hypothetical protein
LTINELYEITIKLMQFGLFVMDRQQARVSHHFGRMNEELLLGIVASFDNSTGLLRRFRKPVSSEYWR